MENFGFKKVSKEDKPKLVNKVFDSVAFRYDLMNDSALRITVYDVQGKLINELYDGFQSAGRNSIIWDATNSVGENVSSGVYLYKIQAGDSYQVKRMMFLK